MRRRYGWGLEGIYGWFMTVAASVIAVAVISGSTGAFLFSHYRTELTPEEAPAGMRQAVRSAAAPPAGTMLWFSKEFHPGDRRLLNVVATGDVMMGSVDSGLNPSIGPGADGARLIGSPLADIFRHADFSFVNLEGPLYDGNGPTAKDCESCFSFRSPTYYADVLASLRVTAVSLTNNHSGDFGQVGRTSTMAALRIRRIAFGGLDQDGARAATLRLSDGLTAAFVAFAPNTGTLDLNDIASAAARIRTLKRSHDVVIVSFHGGGEGWDRVHVVRGQEIFDGEDRGDVIAFAHAAIDAGADIVIGQGPHVPRAIEIYRHHLIAYSLGNFWTYAGVGSYAASGLGPVLQAWLAPDGTVAGLAIHSTRQAGLGIPHADTDDEAARYVYYLTRADFPDTGEKLDNAQRLAENMSFGR
jgi:hypothetical protein